MRQFKRHRTRRTDIVKYHDSARHRSAAIAYRGGGILDCGFDAVAPDQHTVRSEGDGSVLPNRLQHGILGGFARGGVDDPEHVLERMAGGLGIGPASQAFGNGIEIGDVAGDVRAHDGVADGVERHLCALLLICQCVSDHRALDHAAQRFGQQVGVKSGLEEIVLRSAHHRQLRGLLISWVGQDQDRNPGRGLEHAIECLYAAAVGQEQVEQYRCDADKSLESISAGSNPLNLETLVVGAAQRLQDHLCIPDVILDKENSFRHRCCFRALTCQGEFKRSATHSTGSVCSRAHGQDAQ